MRSPLPPRRLPPAAAAAALSHPPKPPTTWKQPDLDPALRGYLAAAHGQRDEAARECYNYVLDFTPRGQAIYRIFALPDGPPPAAAGQPGVAAQQEDAGPGGPGPAGQPPPRARLLAELAAEPAYIHRWGPDGWGWTVGAGSRVRGLPAGLGLQEAAGLVLRCAPRLLCGRCRLLPAAFFTCGFLAHPTGMNSLACPATACFPPTFPGLLFGLLLSPAPAAALL